ncbi:MAG: hypothetical protein OER82_00095 [Nitrosopumilus sp.]|nr:hypothetical protein [Nitrosopumilus sp.]
MKIKCPSCSHRFSPSEDGILFDYSIDYDNDSKFVWERLPILKSVWSADESKDDVSQS